MYARSRDAVQNAGISLANLVAAVLHEKLDKPDDVRCTAKWSNKKLTQEQQVYAAKDTIKVLEVYDRLSDVPDLSERLEIALKKQFLAWLLMLFHRTAVVIPILLPVATMWQTWQPVQLCVKFYHRIDLIMAATSSQGK